MHTARPEANRMALKAKAVQAEAKEAEAAGETADPAEGEAQAKSRKFSLKLIAMAAAGGVVVLGGGTAAYLMLGGGGGHPAAAEAKPARSEERRVGKEGRARWCAPR